MKKLKTFFRQLHFSNILYYLSNTNISLIKNLSSLAQMERKTIGSSILFSALASSVSGLFLADILADNIWITLFSSAIYFFIALYINKAMFSINNKWMGLFRLFSVLLFSFVISIGTEMKTFDKDINAQKIYRLQTILTEQHKKIDVLVAEKKSFINEKNQKIWELEAQFNEIQRLQSAEERGLSITQSGRSSSGSKGKGPKWQAYNTQLESIQKEILKLQKQKNDVENQYIHDISIAESQYTQQKTEDVDSFLSKYVALKDLEGHSDPKIRAATIEISYSIKLIILLIELIPVMMKLLGGKTLYQFELEEQNRLVEMAIISRNGYIEKQIEDLHNKGLPINYTQGDIEARIQQTSKIIDKINNQYKF